MTGEPISDFEGTPDEAARIRVAVVLVSFAALGVLRLSSFYLDDLTRAMTGTLPRRLLEESTGAVTALILFPLMVFAERRFPLTQGRWRRNSGAHVMAFSIFTVLHTTLMAVSRTTLSALLGMGSYDYGVMRVRYFMEASVDVIGYGMIIGVLTVLRVHRRLQLRELRAAAIERDVATARLEALSLRLQPHFLFNALNTISSTVYEDPAAADTMIGRLGDLLRHALRTSSRQETAVSDELTTLQAYLMFVDARFGDRLQVDLDIDPAAYALAVPAFILQPLVENAVRHGGSLESGTNHIRVSVARKDDELALIVRNDLDADQDHGLRFGTGLGTTRDRLRLLYGNKALLSTSRSGGWFTVTIRLPASIHAPMVDQAREEDLAGAHR